MDERAFFSYNTYKDFDKRRQRMWFKNLSADVKAAKANDPAARNAFEILLTYSGVHALMWYRLARFFHRIKLKLIARMISQFARFLTGIEIHPAAKIEGGVFIDHGSGVVIGETAEVHKGTVIYQGVTLGGTGKDKGKKRHPTVKEGSVISAGAKVLGGITVNENCKIGAGSVVLSDVPANSTVVGIPGKVIKRNGQKVKDLQQDKRDPVQEEIAENRKYIKELEQRLLQLENKLKGE